MALRFNGSSYVKQSASITVSTTLTISFWTNITVDTNALVAFVSITDALLNINNAIGLDTNGTTLLFYSQIDATLHTGGALTLDQWYHIAYVRNGSSNIVYLNGVESINVTISPDVDNTAMSFGASTDGNLPFNGRIASVKIWDAALTLNEVLRESMQYASKRTANLRSNFPFLAATDLVDYSATGYTLATTGTVTTEIGPPIPWNQGRAKTYIQRTIAAAATSLLFHPNPMRHMIVR